MSTRETQLSLLACHTDENLLGTVHLQPLPDKIERAWKQLREEYRGKTGSKGNLPYAGLLTVLRAIGYTSATLYPTSKTNPPKYLATTRPIARDDLHAAITLWEQALLHTPAEHFSFGYASELADLIAGTAPEEVSLWEHFTRTTDCIDAPGWVWAAAGWTVAQQLSNEPWTIDGKTITFRPDLDNSLQVWDNDLLWTNTWSAAYGDSDTTDTPGEDDDLAWKTTVRYATLRLEVAVKSHPGLLHPVAVIHPRVSRLSYTLSSARTAWFAPRAADGPLLNLTLGGKGKHTHLDHTTRLALDAWTRLHGEHVFPRNADETDFLAPSALDLSGPPGKLRALVPFSTSSPIGKGVGMYTRRELARYTSTALDQPLLRTREIAGRHFGHGRTTIDGRDAVLLDDPHFDRIIAASGCERLRILALYRHQDMRTRMQRLLAYHFNRPDLATAGLPDDRIVPVTEHVEVLLQAAPDLLAHGDHHDKRAALTRQLTGLQAPDGTRVLALCETEYDAKAWSRQRRASKVPGSATPDPYALDAKPHASRELARLGVLAQFLTPYKPGRRNPKKKDREITTDLQRLGRDLEGDHRGHMAIADLHRAAGLVHPRLTKALTFGPNGLKDPLVHVGLHLRQQLGERRGPLTEEPKLMWTLVALVPRAGQWQTLAFLPDEHRTGGTWLDYATANQAHRARPLPEGRRRDALLPRLVDRALYDLGTHAGTASGYAVYVSGAEARSIWPLLANRHLGKTPDADGLIDKRRALPGFTLPPTQRPQAVVRVTSASDDVASPALIERLVHLDDEETETTQGKLATGLFQMENTDKTFILCNLPHQYTGGSRYARAGEFYTRWGSTDPAEQAETWYSHTATEITVLHHPDGHTPLTYGLAAARLCDHALHFNHRTQYPAPIHLGIQMDKNHPEYRRTIDFFDTDTDPGI
ncbi:RNaseH domain-containing protein [Streptomyces sp. Li-HN-5-11]|uniref:RNaseH domain-containing protein n=1 Tax=Streptomyces sp. Li-HN-5-11 TaxID=3075432 RepID=UPI0028B1CA1E|nr:RNaseH domain-containing protein [Streptomyces sp. Li-HN-5-11]WNM32739.1 RNaseH domain-containing protein [Streptomyces sp. Li-HN-5-11]WOP38521.1 RNaseH domain-containing protein [Streptomyces sp. Li-HN-5-13]